MIHSCVFSDELSDNFQQAIDICAELRVGFIEPRGGLWGQNINTIDLAGARKMQDVMDVYGIKVGCIGSGFGKCSLTDPEEWAEHQEIFERQLKMGTEIFDCRVMRIFPFWVPAGLNWQTERPDLDAYMPQIVEKLQPICQRAEQEGFVLAIEPEGTTFSGLIPEIVAIMDAVGSPALTVAWDVVNSWSHGRIAYPDDYELIRGKVTHVHVKDRTIDPNNPARSTGSTYMGEGDVPWEQVFRDLIDDGYDGMASVETHLFFGMANRFRWLTAATEYALRNLNRTLAKVQGVL